MAKRSTKYVLTAENGSYSATCEANALASRFRNNCLGFYTPAEIGMGLTAFGFLFTFLGVVLFFDRGLLAMGNVSNVVGACTASIADILSVLYFYCRASASCAPQWGVLQQHLCALLGSYTISVPSNFGFGCSCFFWLG